MVVPEKILATKTVTQDTRPHAYGVLWAHEERPSGGRSDKDRTGSR